MLKSYQNPPFATRPGTITFFVLLCVFLGILSACNQPRKNKSHTHVADASIEKGRVLAATHCQSCHLLPDPSLLDAATWENGVLPAMGPRLGIFNYGFSRYPSYKNEPGVPVDYYPQQQLISHVEWQNIIDYYTALSPDTLPAQERPSSFQSGLQGFSIQQPVHRYQSPAICLTEIDTTTTPASLYLFDLSSKNLFRYPRGMGLPDSFSTQASFVDLDFSAAGIVGCNIDVINPNNGKFGKAHMIKTDPASGKVFQQPAFLDSLARPVQISSCDLNNDKQVDYLVCEFGHLAGALSWLEYTGPGKYEAHVLKAAPGAIKAYVEDVNSDGLQDIWALFSQGDEGIFLFINRGNNQFDQQQILRFPSVYGSTHFELVDFNKDGLKDIVYTCGDNADFSLVLKPYHGVYIFLNEGNNKFVQKYFFPINGCYKALARDYDQDGDIDIATISFFADYTLQPEEGFVYLENTGELTFQPRTSPDLNAGRWLTMDAANLDADGRIDIVLGNFSIRPSVTKPRNDWQKGPPFIILKNTGK